MTAANNARPVYGDWGVFNRFMNRPGIHCPTAAESADLCAHASAGYRMDAIEGHYKPAEDHNRADEWAALAIYHHNLI